VNVCAEGVAAAWFASPACAAVTVTLPAPVTVRVEPETVAGPEVTAKLTGKPDDAVAVRVMGATPYVTFANAPNVIVCTALNVRVALLLVIEPWGFETVTAKVEPFGVVAGAT
jgi:hypothetical protein